MANAKVFFETESKFESNRSQLGIHVFGNELICGKGKMAVVVHSKTLGDDVDVVPVKYGKMVAASWRNMLIVGDVYGY